MSWARVRRPSDRTSPTPSAHARSAISRRDLLSGGMGLAALTAATACDSLVIEPDGGSADDPSEDQAKGEQAPGLARRVEEGDLPPVAERLPDSPLVVEPVERPGLYGGTWRSALQGAADDAWLARTIGYECLMRWDPQFHDVLPNVAESIERSRDGREFAITLRSGMKWSDGEAFTTDDLMFAYDDVQRNSRLTPILPSVFILRNKPMTMEKVDHLTVRVTFDDPNSLFLQQMAVMEQGNLLCLNPRHYLEQFHADYTSHVDELADEAGFNGWEDLFESRSDPWENSELPTLLPWSVNTELGAGEQVVAQRNPYYWKVDSDGSQLPYIDSVIYDVVTEEEVMLMKTTNGEIDFHTRHINTLPNKPVLADARDEGEYVFQDLENTLMNEMVIAFNLTHPDEALREVFQNRQFRIGLSHAIDRIELIDTVFQKQGEPWQAAPGANSKFFDEEMATQFTEYDVDLANEYLDEAGYGQRDSEGMRLGPDRNRIVFDVDVATPALTPAWVDAMNLIVEYWSEVGIWARLENRDRSLFYERKEANEHDANVWTGDGGVGDEILEPRWYFPFSDESNFAVPWAEWFSTYGEDGDEPPAATRRQMELYWQLASTTDTDERDDIFRQILEIAKEEFYVIGTVVVPEMYGIRKRNLHNVPASMPESARFNTPGPTNPEQYFFSA